MQLICMLITILFSSQCTHNLILYIVIDSMVESREGSGSVVECLNQDRGATGSSLTGVTALLSLSKTHLS